MVPLRPSTRDTMPARQQGRTSVAPEEGTLAACTRTPIRDLAARIAEQRDLPPLPVVATRVLALTADAGAQISAIAILVTTDAVLAARVLKIASSITQRGLTAAAKPGQVQSAAALVSAMPKSGRAWPPAGGSRT